jgi:CRISPR-associated protein Cas5d
MFHGFDYPDEIGRNEFHSRFWQAKMVDGVVEFPRPEACPYRKLVRPMTAQFIQTNGLDEEGLLEGYEEEVMQ